MSKPKSKRATRLVDLHGGPYNGRASDKPMVNADGTIRFHHASQTRANGKPKVGARIGFSVYEISDCGAHAYFLVNQWVGTCVDSIGEEGGDE